METRLKELRKAAGFSNRDDFARHIGVNPNTYKTWETGSVTINVQQACMLSRVLGCTLDDLVGITKRMPAGIEPDMYAEEAKTLLDLFAKIDHPNDRALLIKIARAMTDESYEE